MDRIEQGSHQSSGRPWPDLPAAGGSGPDLPGPDASRPDLPAAAVPRRGDLPEPPAYAPGLVWRPLRQADLPALTGLARRCAAVDGGQPFATDPSFIRGNYLAGDYAIGLFDGPAMVCASAARPTRGRLADRGAVTSGMVDPTWRRHGLGGQGLDWALGTVGEVRTLAESEMLSDGAHALYLSRNMVQILAENVMQLPSDAPVPAVAAPAGITFAEWGAADADRFFEVYAAAFADRPGFPGWSAEEWIAWISGDEDFRREWTLLASHAPAGQAPADVGFVAGEATGWIAQVGVVPQARGRGLGASLIAEVIRRMRAAGETTVTLNVHVNNARAEALYQRLGFLQIGRRGRYLREATG